MKNGPGRRIEPDLSKHRLPRFITCLRTFFLILPAELREQTHDWRYITWAFDMMNSTTVTIGNLSSKHSRRFSNHELGIEPTNIEILLTKLKGGCNQHVTRYIKLKFSQWTDSDTPALESGNIRSLIYGWYSYWRRISPLPCFIAGVHERYVCVCK
jgi:hypothetical protein